MAVGDIGAALTDSLLVLNSTGEVRSDVAHARDEWFVVVYHEASTTDTILATFSVDDCGNIPASVQDSLVIDTDGAGNSPDPRVVKVATGIVAITWDDNAACANAKVGTFSVDGCGNLNCCDPIDTLLLDPADGVSGGPTIHPTKYSNVFVILWFSVCGADLQMSSFTIDACGNISTEVEQVEVTCIPGTATPPDFIYTGVGDFHAVSYSQRTSDDGFLQTYTIDACGNIGCVADTLEFEPTEAKRISIESNGAGTLLLFYAGPGGGGDVRTITVDACGVLTDGTKIDVGVATGTTDLVKLGDDTTGNNTFLGVASSFFRSWQIDACDVPSEIDSLSSIGEVTTRGRLTLIPGNTAFIVASGFKSTGTEFYVMTLAVEQGAVPDLAQPVLPQLAFLPFTNLAPAPSFAWFPGLDEEDVRGNLLAKLKAGGVV